MLPPIPIPEHYDVSSKSGFLPSELPLDVLPDPYYQRWETVIKNLQGLILSRRLRGVVDTLPVLSTDHLASEPEWRRAYHILAFISHAYIWGGDYPAEVIPPAISIPFLSTCEHLELPPVATYASLVLWNFKPLFADEDIDNLENLSTLSTFTGSLDESWFYLVSAAIEARGAATIPLMLSAVEAARANDAYAVTTCLRAFAERLDELGTLLERMYENCDPHVFYHRIRPFLAGGKNMAESGLPRGILFDDGTGARNYVHYSGGSNAQSSLIQFFDLILGIEHLPTGRSKHPSNPSPSSSDSESPFPPSSHPTPHNSFITDMRTYMPGPHRRFLTEVSRIANIHAFVAQSGRSDSALTGAYDACLAMLRALRDKHIQLVSRYIVVKSRETRSHSRSLSPRQAPNTGRVNLATASKMVTGAANGHGTAFGATGTGPGATKLRGTGGTALIPFLKQARDETGAKAVGDWARRLLTNGPSVGLGGVELGAVDEHANGRVEIVGLAGIWSVDDSEGGICHW